MIRPRFSLHPCLGRRGVRLIISGKVLEKGSTWHCNPSFFHGRRQMMLFRSWHCWMETLRLEDCNCLVVQLTNRYNAYLRFFYMFWLFWCFCCLMEEIEIVQMDMQESIIYFEPPELKLVSQPQQSEPLAAVFGRQMVVNPMAWKWVELLALTARSCWALLFELSLAHSCETLNCLSQCQPQLGTDLIKNHPKTYCCPGSCAPLGVVPHRCFWVSFKRPKAHGYQGILPYLPSELKNTSKSDQSWSNPPKHHFEQDNSWFFLLGDVPDSRQARQYKVNVPPWLAN